MESIWLKPPEEQLFNVNDLFLSELTSIDLVIRSLFTGFSFMKVKYPILDTSVKRKTCHSRGRMSICMCASTIEECI